MADEDEPPARPVRLVPRGPLDAALNPTNIERLERVERDWLEVSERLVAVEQAVAALTAPVVQAIYPQNPWARIAEARVSLAEKLEAGIIDEVIYDEAMSNLAASERMSNVALSSAEAIIVELDERRGDTD